MQCQVCPQCKFRVAPGTHICRTCGFNFPRREMSKQPAPSETCGAKQQTASKGFWQSLFSASGERPAKEKRHEEPALET